MSEVRGIFSNMDCGNLNVIGPHNLTGTGTIGRCNFDRMDMDLLEEVFQCGSRF